MALRDLGTWLIELPGFRKLVKRVAVDAVCDELGRALVRAPEWHDLAHDWGYLLLGASVLAQEEDEGCQAAALRIAQACLCDSSVSERRRDSAAVILDALANRPAINLAVQRTLLQPGFEDRVPIPVLLELRRRSYEHSIEFREQGILRVNRFQRRLWDKLGAERWASVSAPTSAGKSFILARWICELMQSSQSVSVVYLVPTRALISQVERDLRDVFLREGLTDVSISTVPIAGTTNQSSSSSPTKMVFVFTQERAHIQLMSEQGLSVQAMVIDEAQKVGDGQRGVLLQDVIERVVHKNVGVRVVFASPMTSNPGVLLDDAPGGAAKDILASHDVTVLQNLFWVSQRPRKPRLWDVSLCMREENVLLGSTELAAAPSSDRKRLSFLAHALTVGSQGTIVYVNGAAEAEKIAGQLFDLCAAEGPAEGVEELIELVEVVVHQRYLLARYLRRGIAFHYGNMPMLIRDEVERLFSLGVIRYLVCTSTLIEGVNMSCRNIFMRGPRKGLGNPLSSEDFWNLAGRAGRWGKEFQGNVFCIDPTQPRLWGEHGPPRERRREPIRRATDRVLAEPEKLIEYMRTDSPLIVARDRAEYDYVFSYLAASHVRFGALQHAPWADRYGGHLLEQFSVAVSHVVDSLSIVPELYGRNPGISPYAMEGLLIGFREREGDVEDLLPVNPASIDAPENYTAIFRRLSKRACPNLGPTPGRAFMLALLVTRWMRGFSLAHLIADRINYRGRKGAVDVATEIRSVMNDVEQVARFEAPRGLACYCDVLRQHLMELGRDDLIGELPDLNIYLELGVNQITQISMIGVGLSRTSAVLVSDYIASDSLGESEVIGWLRDNEETWRNASLPALVKRELERVLLRRGAG